MKKRLYNIIDEKEIKSVVIEYKRQKDILDQLDELLENTEFYSWEHVFENDSFYIEYKDGKIYEVNCCGEYGVYKKKGIERIIYSNACDTQVYGRYEVNEYGVVF